MIRICGFQIDSVTSTWLQKLYMCLEGYSRHSECPSLAWMTAWHQVACGRQLEEWQPIPPDELYVIAAG